MATAGTGQNGSYGAGQNGFGGARQNGTFEALSARRRQWRWLVPAAAAGLVAGALAVSNAVADAPPSLPSRTPAQVLALAAGTQVRAFSGSVTTHAALGLPDLSALQQLAGGKAGAGGSSSSSVTDLTGLATRFVTGDTSMRVWHAATGDRVQLIDTLGEVDLVRNGTEVWAYSSTDRVAAHASLTDAAGKAPGTHSSGTLPTPPTPQALADQVLKGLDPTTTVSLDAPARVADRPAYRLVLTPRTAGTLVSHVDLDVDATTGAALQVAVYGRGATAPAIKVGFTSVDLTAPAASTFTFTPPAGVKVTTLGEGLPKAGTGTTRPGMTTKPTTKPHVVGTGWDAVAIADARLVGGTDGAALSGVLGGAMAGATAGQLAGGSGTDPAKLLQGLTTAVPGGHGVQTALASVLLTDDGRVLVGAVPLSSLSSVAAADLAAK
jgi:outer membrane lipoprotein-sorting protein